MIRIDDNLIRSIIREEVVRRSRFVPKSAIKDLMGSSAMANGTDFGDWEDLTPEEKAAAQFRTHSSSPEDNTTIYDKIWGPKPTEAAYLALKDKYSEMLRYGDLTLSQYREKIDWLNKMCGIDSEGNENAETKEPSPKVDDSKQINRALLNKYARNKLAEVEEILVKYKNMLNSHEFTLVKKVLRVCAKRSIPAWKVMEVFLHMRKDPKFSKEFIDLVMNKYVIRKVFDIWEFDYAVRTKQYEMCKNLDDFMT